MVNNVVIITITFLCLILQTTRPTTLQQKEDLMHTHHQRLKYQAYTHRFYLTCWWSGDQLFLITEHSCNQPQLDLQDKPMGQSQVLHTSTCVS